jgi:recombination protein U
MSIQPDLPGQKHISHAHRGRSLEDLLDRTHAKYEREKKASIEKNPVEWRYTDKNKYDYLCQNSKFDVVARTNTGRYLVRKKSDVDYSGVVAPVGRFFTFDAKETAVKNFSLQGLEKHQLETLEAKDRIGALAGLMVYFSSLNRLFFLHVKFVREAEDARLFKRGAKSIPLKTFEEIGREIPTRGDVADWYSVLFGEK